MTPYRSELPVICIGNLTAGGAGKTPTAIAVAERLRAAGRRPAFLLRGYGGSLAGPLLVSPGTHTAVDVGDEALLLAARAPTVIARDRNTGARLIEGLGGAVADVIVMDDGFQNPSLAKDLCIVVIDGGRGVGNGLVMPAGPLRLPLGWQLERADALVVFAASGLDRPAFLRSFSRPVLTARIEPEPGQDWMTQGPLVAFAGIGRPSKLFETLVTAGGKLAGTRAFPDHHVFTDAEARELLTLADQHAARLVTTEKDWCRLGTEGVVGELKACAHRLLVRAEFDDERSLDRLLAEAVKRRSD